MPHCPTYRELRDEAESPRGRIALIQGWAEGQLADSPRLDRHLSNCLECRACETACPSLVNFVQLMDDARALKTLRAGRIGVRAQQAWLDALSSDLGARAAAFLAGLYQTTGAARLASATGLARLPSVRAYHRLTRHLKRPSLPVDPTDPRGGAGQELDLFVGCIGRAAQPRALEAARTVLARLGYRVNTPAEQGCCGAMHRHNGFPEKANQLLEKNAEVFADRSPIGIASACVAELRTHPRLEGTEEICRFLSDLRWPDEARLRPLPGAVAVHEPCTQRNILRDASAASDLIRRIPGVRIVPLFDNASCCGAAGTYLLQNPRMSQKLLQPKIDRLAQEGLRTVVTTNTGCALHLSAGIQEANLRVEVLHPVELIARQLG